jgi:glycosyltransferase involved in cell wall biosynthesis
MKVTILSAAYPLRGGISHFVGLLYKKLSAQNQVNVITFKRQYPSIFFPGKSQLEINDNVEKIPTEVLVDSINPFNWINVGMKIKKDAPDLLIFKYWMPFFGPCFGTISRIVRSNKKTKILVICDNVIPHERKPGDIIFTKYFLKTVNYFVVMSKSVQKDLEKLIPNAENRLLFHPVYSNFGNVVDKDEARKKLNLSAEKVILFFGFIRKYKGLDTLFNALSYLKDFNLTAVIAGEFYTDKEEYIKLMDKLGINDSVKLFNDFIPTSEVKYYFSAADVVVLPYKDATQSGIIQIANNFKKPVIATDVGGLGEIIHNGKNGYIVEKENPKKLSEAIKKFYEEKKEEEFSKNIQEESEKYSWERFVEGIMEMVNINI